MTSTPKLWRDMTPEEKGALLLARHEGKNIECSLLGNGEWEHIYQPSFVDCHAYRKMPAPVVETRTGHCWAYAYLHLGPGLYDNGTAAANTAHGTWTCTTRDGKPVRIVWEAAE